MNPSTRTILMLFLAGVLAVGVVAYYMFQKTHDDLRAVEPDFSLAADALFHEYETDEGKADALYLNKVININGILAEKSELGENEAVLFVRSEDQMFGISCAFSGESVTTAMGLKEGAEVSIKGVCTGINMDVNLVRCVLNE